MYSKNLNLFFQKYIFKSDLLIEFLILEMIKKNKVCPTVEY